MLLPKCSHPSGVIRFSANNSLRNGQLFFRRSAHPSWVVTETNPDSCLILLVGQRLLESLYLWASTTQFCQTSPPNLVFLGTWKTVFLGHLLSDKSMHSVAMSKLVQRIPCRLYCIRLLFLQCNVYRTVRFRWQSPGLWIHLWNWLTSHGRLFSLWRGEASLTMRWHF